MILSRILTTNVKSMLLPLFGVLVLLGIIVSAGYFAASKLFELFTGVTDIVAKPSKIFAKIFELKRYTYNLIKRNYNFFFIRIFFVEWEKALMGLQLIAIFTKIYINNIWNIYSSKYTIWTHFIKQMVIFYERFEFLLYVLYNYNMMLLFFLKFWINFILLINFNFFVQYQQRQVSLGTK